jgi:hypothetical protein
MSDPAFTCHFLDHQQHRDAEQRRMTLAKQRESDPAWMKANNATWARLDEVVAPCAMWFGYWLFDPEDPEHARCRAAALAAIADGSFGKPERNYYLSRFYWTQWSDKRPPICVLTPNGKEWVVDAKSSNGEGWQVQGDPPLLVVTPSIDVPGFHGFLGSNGAPPGVFKVA